MVKLIKIDGIIIIGAFKKIEDLNKKIEAIDKQFNVLKTLINDLNKQRLD